MPARTVLLVSSPAMGAAQLTPGAHLLLWVFPLLLSLFAVASHLWRRRP